MADGMTKLEAVRRAVERLGAAPAAELAAHIEAELGIRIQPVIVTVLLGTLAEREQRAANRQRAQDAAPPPPEAAA